MSDAPERTAPGTASARRTWWPGWIWSVPIAALAIGIWLLVRVVVTRGTNVTITFDDAHGVKPKSTGVEYRGMQVGEVTDVSLTDDGRRVEVTVSIQGPAADLLRTGTVFWLQGAKPSLSDPASLGAVLSGPTIELEPGAGARATHFEGLARKPAVPRDHGPPVRFRVSFDGHVGDLSGGDAVELRGFPVGEVEKIDFHYDADSGTLATPVTLALYPALFHVERSGEAAPDGDTFRAAVDRLVGAGLRAELARDPPVVGGHRVALEIVPGAPEATVQVVDGLPQIPTAPAGGLESVVQRVRDVPIHQIGQNVLDITKHVDEIASSPALAESVQHLDASLRRVDQLLDDVTPQVDRIVRVLHDAAADLRRTARSADRTLGGPASQTGVTDTLREVKDAARSIRSLADYLDRHPEALISGKAGP